MKKMGLMAMLLCAVLFTGLGVTSAMAEGMKCGPGKCGAAMMKSEKKSQCGNCGEKKQHECKCEDGCKCEGECKCKDECKCNVGEGGECKCVGECKCDAGSTAGKSSAMKCAPGKCGGK